jgi:type I restriction enzyme S subunit
MVEPLFDKILSNVQEQTILSDLRDTLLPRLISGKLRVPEAEAMIAKGGE